MWRKLRLILWKNFIIRKRHLLLTLIEIFIPILLFTLVAYGRSKISGIRKTYVEEPTYYDINTENDIYSHLSVGELNLYYLSHTDFTENVIRGMQQKLQIPGDAVKKFQSRDELLKAFEQINSTFLVAAVIFNGNDSQQLNYDLTISDKYFTWNTDKLYIPIFTPEDERSSKYLYKGYAALQVAIDMSYIELHADRKIVAFSLQEFPDPPRTVDSGLTQLSTYFLPLITIFSFIFLCPAVLQRVGEEKSSGIKEYLNMVGLKSWMIWLGWFIHALTTNLFSIIVIVVLMKVPFWGVPYPPIEYSDGTVLFLFLFMYCMAAVTFCFLIATIFNTPSIATVMGILFWIFSYFIPQTFVSSREYLQWKWKIPFALFPNMALHYGYSAISVYEMREVGIQWQNIFEPGSGDENDVTMGNVLLTLMFDMYVFMLLTLYIENIKPGEYGIAKSYGFPLTSLKKLIKKCFEPIKKCFEHSDKISSEATPFNNVEAGTKDICIKICELYKKYSKRVAVDNLDLDIYKNRITVLLGQNGAGKTTTMSILAGMISATSGAVFINGKNIKEHTDDVRKIMGLCTQHNLLFTDLTVMEHLELFAMLKGSTSPSTDAMEMLKKLGIDDKNDSMAHTLSGGMKRKLCLGMALIGKSEILILDEPTSGMDPESRRQVWNLLLEERNQKTILITTHFMEEADVLGEHIAIMANGRLQCHGTASELKAQYNTGYHISLLLQSKDHLTDITHLVEKHFNESKLLRENKDFVVYLLPIKTNKTGYKNLIKELEEKQVDMDILAINLSETTLNDVFLKAKDEIDGTSKSQRDLHGGSIASSTTSPHELIIFWALIQKRLYFVKRKYHWFIPAIVVATSIFMLAIWLALSSNGYYEGGGPSLNLTLQAYGKPRVYYGGKNTSNHLIESMKKYYADGVLTEKGHPVLQEDVSNALIKEGINNIAFYKRHMVVAAEFNYTESQNKIIVNSMFSPEALHSIPISINLAMNSLIKTLRNSSFSITIGNTPLQPPTSKFAPSELSVINVASVWLILIPLSMFFLMSNFIIFPNTEISTDFLQIQTIAGIKTYLYWFSNITFDVIFSLIPSILLLFVLWLLNALAYNSIAFKPDEFGAIAAIFILYIITSLPFTYLLSYRKTITGGFTLLIMFGIFVGIIPTLIIIALEFSQEDYYKNIAKCLKPLLTVISPHFALSYICVKFSKKYVENFNWEYMDPDKRNHICTFYPNPCCHGIYNARACHSYQNYFLNKELGIGEDLLIMTSSFMLYFSILIIINTDWLKKVLHFITYFYLNFSPHKNTITDNNDKTSTMGEVERREEDTDGTLRVTDLTKAFGRKQVVKNLKFYLKKNQCFGLLGVNGAGKSTTFRMLTKDLLCDKGDIYIKEEKNIFITQSEYCQRIGYCPQEDCLNYYLTGRELLYTLARVKGYSDTADKLVDNLLKSFDLQEVADQPCLEYSGGNKRKLSSCLAFLGSPKIILLDEPTSGVDPASRRKFWNVLSCFKETKDTSLLLCSHSMEESENLCDEIAIMKGGIIKDQGSLLHLKNKYQKGFKVTIKFASEPNEEVKNQITSKLHVDNILQRYAESITYQVSSKIRLSGLFDALEELKSKYDKIIEDYIINQISLEDIFLSVAEEDESNNTSGSNQSKRNWFNVHSLCGHT